MTPKPALSGRKAAANQQTVTNFQKVRQITYHERLYAKTGDIPNIALSVNAVMPFLWLRGLQMSADARVAVASKSALAACQPVAALSGNGAPLQPLASGTSIDLESALAELNALRSEMAALQAALGVLKGSQNTTEGVAAVQEALLCHTSRKWLAGVNANASCMIPWAHLKLLYIEMLSGVVFSDAYCKIPCSTALQWLLRQVQRHTYAAIHIIPLLD